MMVTLMLLLQLHELLRQPGVVVLLLLMLQLLLVLILVEKVAVSAELLLMRRELAAVDAMFSLKEGALLCQLHVGILKMVMMNKMLLLLRVALMRPEIAIAIALLILAKVLELFMLLLMMHGLFLQKWMVDEEFVCLSLLQKQRWISNSSSEGGGRVA
jgi:hypothetical protein